MSSTFSTNLAIELIGTGDQAGTWGTTTNSNLGTLIEQSISGYVTQAVSTGTDTTITIPNGASGVARNMYIELTGTGGASTNLIVPANKKLYFIFNNSSGAVTVKVTGQTGVSVPTGKKMVLVSNGTDIVNGLNYIADFASNSATITHLSATSATITNLTLTSLVISNLSIASANITTLTGSTQTLSGNLTLNGGTANGVAFLNGSKVVTSGTALVFDGTNLGIGTTSPAERLHVVSGANTTQIRFGDNTNCNGFLGSRTGNLATLHTDQILAFGTGNSTFTERMRLDTSGNLGIGTTSPGYRLTVSGGGTSIAANQYLRFGNGIFASSDGSVDNYLFTGSTALRWRNSADNAELMQLTNTGNLGIGTASPGEKLDVAGNARSNAWIGRANGSAPTADAAIYRPADNTLGFSTNNTERARITSGGDFVVGKTTAVIGTAGGYITGLGEAVFTVAGNPVLYVNRLTDDGDLVRFYQADTQEGSISVSGNTVSYNAFAGSHWSQLQDGSKPDILRGTVMESINELCVWPDEQNERLPKSKVSDTAGSKKVYGVFMAWDNDWATTNDMYITAVGAFICRVNASVTVQEGDLLESNGDGTARVQADDIIRSSTIGKVTSTVKTHQYADGSYCVPTVLYCG